MHKSQPHAVTGIKLNYWLLRYLSDDWMLGVRLSIRFTTSVPEADVTIVRGQPDDYGVFPPPPDAIGLLIEISDGSKATDHTNKLPMYAAEAIVCVWLISIPDRQIEVYSAPDAEAGRYTQRTVYAEDDAVSLVLDGVTIAALRVGDVLPAERGA